MVQPTGTSEPVADLQLHSSASDGSDRPSEVVRRAHAMGFAAIALTDHDTTAGLAEAGEAARSLGIELVPACELSTLDANDRQIDILGYGIDPADPAFGVTLATIRAGRGGRAEGMVELINVFSLKQISIERVREIAGGENIGRPHVARAMVEAGVVPDMKSAFVPEWILDGGRCYVQRVKITPEEAIQRIHAAGGVAVAAHPARTGLTDDDVERLAASDLDGLEVFYPRHDAAQTAHFARLAGRYSLLVTGGSDDHGDVNEGRLMGSIRLPYVYVARLKRAIAARSASRVAAAGVAGAQ
jgi:3',5'-nucleoside bisphosphate phosphatase